MTSANIKFFDRVKVYLSSGRGGNGCCSFRRLKYIPRGGPDGGNGGKGGDLYIKGNHNLNTLNYYHNHNKHKAPDGSRGAGQNRNGAKGEDIILEVPIGTQVFDTEENLICDIIGNGVQIKILEGGRGGIGNTFFKNSIDKAPTKTTKGEEPQEGDFIFKLKSIADIGIIGLPNAGKSSFINSITNAKSEIGDYAFTTTRPILGFIEDLKMTICDIPGLIKNAHQGKGLGIHFLQHIERCILLIHIIDIDSYYDIIENYDIIQNEMKYYSEDILKKEQILILNKIDKKDKKEIQQIKKNLEKHTHLKVFPISTVTQDGINKVLEFLENN